MKASIRKERFLIGIDEVGRGPIAGPVAVGAFLMPTGDLKKMTQVKKLFRGVRESKQLSAESREEWFAKLVEAKKVGLIDYAVSFQSEKVIDGRGISFAIRKALATSLEKVLEIAGATPDGCQILLDGGLKAPPEFLYQKTIIKGDEKEMVIALASICAKVLRDRRMILLGRKHPGYGLEIHKGYGTKGHYQAIKNHGLLAVHRKTWISM